jgi:hypothetical protein
MAASSHHQLHRNHAARPGGGDRFATAGSRSDDRNRRSTGTRARPEVDGLVRRVEVKLDGVSGPRSNGNAGKRAGHRPKTIVIDETGKRRRRRDTFERQHR